MAAKSFRVAQHKRGKQMNSARGKYMRACKGAKHAHVTLRAIGHFAYLRIVKRYTRQLGRKLTPAELAHIRAVHADEIAASCIGQPWPKKQRASYPEL
jgi:hypothetical protein